VEPSRPHIVYTPRPEAASEEVSVLANLYHFIINCHAKKEAAPESRPEDARKELEAEEQAVRVCLEVIEVEGKVRA
jgi:hypothetical protein